MSGIHLLDLLSHERGFSQSNEANESLVAKLAARMVINSIETIKVLRELRPKMFPSSTEPQAIALAKALRVEFEEWVSDAESLLAEATSLNRAGHSIPHLNELGDFSGLTQAMLQITLEDHLESLDQVRRGETVTYSSMGELRRELQLNRNG
jgi:hypothetical protein